MYLFNHKCYFGKKQQLNLVKNKLLNSTGTPFVVIKSINFKVVL